MMPARLPVGVQLVSLEVDLDFDAGRQSAVDRFIKLGKNWKLILYHHIILKKNNKKASI